MDVTASFDLYMRSAVRTSSRHVPNKNAVTPALAALRAVLLRSALARVAVVWEGSGMIVALTVSLCCEFGKEDLTK